MSNDNTGTFLNFTLRELAQGTATELKPFIEGIFENLLNQKAEDDDKPMSFQEACDWLNISRATMSELIKRGEIPYKSLNPDNPKAKKFFLKSDLREWLMKNKVKTIQELKAGTYGKSGS